MRRLFRPLRTSLLMLLLAAFVVVPVADALACALEPESADAVHTPAAAHADGEDSDGKHAGSCSHNHCHHSNLSPAGERPRRVRRAATGALDAGRRRFPCGRRPGRIEAPAQSVS